MITPSPEQQLKPDIERWAQMVLWEFDAKVRMLKIHQGALVNSFQQHVYWHAGGDLHKIEFAFNYYGKFVDMGVGHGVSLENREALISTGNTNRRPKRWFTSTFNRQVAILRSIISQRLARNTQLFIVRNTQDNADGAQGRTY